jgi:acyl-CoA thioester hydrolase/carnitine 3-dehydrogenase
MASPLDHLETAPLRLWQGEVLSDWLDYNGHMTEHRYLQVFGDSSDALYQLIGVDFTRADEGAFYTLETHIRHIAEAKLGTALWSDTEILAYDEKRLHLWHRIFDGADRLLATGEHLSIHVHQAKAGRASVEILGRIARIFEAQRSLPVPEGTGKVLRCTLAHQRPGA